MAPLKEKLAEGKANLTSFLMLFHPTTIKEMIAKAKTMTPVEIILAIFTTLFWTTYGLGSFLINTGSFSYGILITLMRGSESDTTTKKAGDEEEKQKKAPIGMLLIPIFIITRNIIKSSDRVFIPYIFILYLAMPDDGGGEEGEQAGDVLAIEDKTEKSAERYN